MSPEEEEQQDIWPFRKRLVKTVFALSEGENKNARFTIKSVGDESTNKPFCC